MPTERTRGLSTLIKDHLAGGASRLHPSAGAAPGTPGLASLLLPQIFPIFSVVAPGHPGAALRDLVLVQRGQATRPLGTWSAAPARRARSLAGAALLLLVCACRQDMHDQPKYQPLERSSFFADDQASRPVVSGTVARGQLNDDALFHTGKVNGSDALFFPFRVDERVMIRGQERFNIHCSPCHGRTGQGDGMVVRRGYRRPPPFADERLRQAPVGHFFDVITSGFGAMPDYAAEIKPADRWAIVAYVRALQLSAHATLEDVPAAERGRLETERR